MCCSNKLVGHSRAGRPTPSHLHDLYRLEGTSRLKATRIQGSKTRIVALMVEKTAAVAVGVWRRQYDISVCFHQMVSFRGRITIVR